MGAFISGQKLSMGMMYSPHSTMAVHSTSNGEVLVRFWVGAY